MSGGKIPGWFLVRQHKNKKETRTHTHTQMATSKVNTHINCFPKLLHFLLLFQENLLVYFSLHVIRVHLGLGRNIVGVPLRFLLRSALLLHRLHLHSWCAMCSSLIEFACRGLLLLLLVSTTQITPTTTACLTLRGPALGSSARTTRSSGFSDAISFGCFKLHLEV